MNEKNIKVKNIVPKCGADVIMPFAFVYIFYIILHGHLSPGGGFQGGILAVALVILLYLGYGYKTTKQALMPEAMRRLEGLALVIYVVLAMAGIVYAGQFCQNFAFNNGHIGELHSAGTIAFMDEAVAFNVVTGSIVLSLGMLGLLLKQDEES